jgi:hypothetical protein
MMQLMLIIKIKSVCNVRRKWHKLRKRFAMETWHAASTGIPPNVNLNIDLWQPTYFQQSLRASEYGKQMRIIVYFSQKRIVFCIINSGLKSIFIGGMTISA